MSLGLTSPAGTVARELFESGHVRPIIDGPYRLEDTPEAFRIFGRGEHRGKMVITVAKG